MIKIQWLPAILPLLFPLHPLNADTKIYHWKSEDGQSHFSDKQPASTHQPRELKPSQLNTMAATATPSPSAVKKQTSPPHPEKKSHVTAKTKQAERCAKYQNQLRALRGKMRNGYTAKQAPKLLQRERKLNDLRHQYCH